MLSGGDNVSPARIEGMLTLQPEIAQAMVLGDKRPHLIALLVLSPVVFKLTKAYWNGGAPAAGQAD